MRVGDFKLEIIGGRDAGEYVHLAHGAVYSIRLHSYSQRDCDVTLELDGKRVETFRLKAGTSFELERPPSDSGRFTFYHAGSEEAIRVGERGVDRDLRGLVVATFKVGKLPVAVAKCAEPPAPPAMRLAHATNFDEPAPARSRGFGAGGQSFNCSAGVTGLSGHSAQRFITVADLDFDPAVPETRINVRLVGENGPRPLVAASARPKALSNPVPPPVS